MKRPGQYQQTATIRILVICLSLAAAGCSDDESVEIEQHVQERANTAPAPIVREWYPSPKPTGPQIPMMPMQQPMSVQPGTVNQPAPSRQTPQVIIVQPGYQPQYGQWQQQQASQWPQTSYSQQQPAMQQQYTPQYQNQYQNQYQPQYQYGQRPWGETGSFGQSRTAQPASGGRQRTFGVPGGTLQTPPGSAYPGWGISPPGTFPGNPWPGSVW